MKLERVRAALERRPVVADLALTAGVALAALFFTLVLVVPNALTSPPPVPVIVLWGMALAAPLVLRRRFPVTVLVVTGVHFMGYWAVGQPNEIGAWLVLGVALYSAAVHGRRPTAGRVTAVAVEHRERLRRQRKRAVPRPAQTIDPARCVEGQTYTHPAWGGPRVA
jgi:hypothetical protein